ncbi:MAG: selenide, water dikinase SelD [bacterium]
MASEDLVQILSDLPEQVDDNLLVAGGPDDSGVYRIDDDNVMIQSVDFFTPIVDDPEAYGTIAAANSVSDIYAMGARPQTALNITGVPLEQVGIDRLKLILKAGQETMLEAGGVVVGGHTVKSPEPLYGMAVTGATDDETFLENARVRPGDRLILTKPIGTGIVTTAHKKQALPEGSILREAITWMSQLNNVGATLAEESLVSSMTDITGYGLVGHMLELLGEDFGASIEVNQIPLIDGLIDLIEAGHVPGGSRDNWKSVKHKVELETNYEYASEILGDAQTSGGLLLSVPETNLGDVKDVLSDRQLKSNVIGEIKDEAQITVY